MPSRTEMTDPVPQLPNQRMKLSWRGGRSKEKEFVLMAAAAPRSFARFVRQRVTVRVESKSNTRPLCPGTTKGRLYAKVPD